MIHDKALRSTHAIVAAVKQGQWEDPTPWTEWNVRALVNHILAENLWVDPLVAGRTIEDVGDRYDGDVLGDDSVAAYDSSARAASHAFHRPGAMDAPVAVSYGPVPGRGFARHRILDLARLEVTTVAAAGKRVVGFVMVLDDEIEQLYVDRPARGSGVAAALLAHGETIVGERSDLAWLAVVAGNGRPRRFYERNGWSDQGAIDSAQTAIGTTVAVPARRYEKGVVPQDLRSSTDNATRQHRTHEPEGGRGTSPMAPRP
ncbi:MAG: TIGR03086 family metal-binding protein [Acidimicrobiales bacterium]